MSASAIRHAAHAALDAYAADERAAIEAEAASDWDAPVPFDGADVPAFPVDALPDWLAAWVRAEADALQVPPDLPAVLGLSTVALCCAKRIVVQVNDGWREPVNLYAAVVLAPGEGKSPAFNDAVRPAFDWEAREAERMAPIIAEAEERARVGDERRKQLRARAAKSKNKLEREAVEHELAELARNAEAVPRAPCLIAADATPEAVAQLLADQSGRLGIFSDEGGPFEIMRGRYSEGRVNFEVFLQAHSGSPLAIDRVNRPRIRVRNPALTMALTVQPDVISGLASEPRLRGRGLLARFIYSLPRSRVGTRAPKPEPVPVAVGAGYQRAIGALLPGEAERGDDGEIVPRAVRLTPDAHAAFVALRERIEPRLGPAGDLASMADWGNKLPGLVLRLAGLLHVADRCSVETSEPIEASTMERAIAIGDYAVEHARAAFGLMASDPTTELAKRVLGWARAQGHSTFTRREAQRRVNVSAAELDAAIAVLVERQYVRPVEQPPPAGRGRPPSPAYEINPRTKR